MRAEHLICTQPLPKRLGSADLQIGGSRAR